MRITPIIRMAPFPIRRVSGWKSGRYGDFNVQSRRNPWVTQRCAPCVSLGVGIALIGRGRGSSRAPRNCRFFFHRFRRYRGNYALFRISIWRLPNFTSPTRGPMDMQYSTGYWRRGAAPRLGEGVGRNDYHLATHRSVRAWLKSTKRGKPNA